jgi:hypothetical protein
VINTVKWGHPVCSRIVVVQLSDLVFSSAAAVVKTVAGVLVRPTGVLVMSAVWGVVSGRMGSALNPPACSPSTRFWTDGRGMWTERNVVRVPLSGALTSAGPVRDAQRRGGHGGGDDGTVSAFFRWAGRYQELA